MGWILRSSDPECVEEGLAGGKGASLAKLARLGVTVPRFLVISTAAYREMESAGPTPQLRDELEAALGGFDRAGGFAVRSSAVGEDAADSSFAGLYHTSLDVSGIAAILEAVKACWASYQTAPAVEYRIERSAETDGAMAVVVQEMVHGEWSGVCFTANPVNLSLSQTVINAVPRDLAVVVRLIGEKASEAGGSAVPEAKVEEAAPAVEAKTEEAAPAAEAPAEAAPVADEAPAAPETEAPAE